MSSSNKESTGRWTASGRKGSSKRTEQPSPAVGSPAAVTTSATKKVGAWDRTPFEQSLGSIDQSAAWGCYFIFLSKKEADRLP